MKETRLQRLHTVWCHLHYRDRKDINGCRELEVKEGVEKGVCACILTPVWLCDPTDYSPSGSSVHGIFQARILQWVAISSSRGSDPGVEPAPPESPALRRILHHWAARGAHAACCIGCVCFSTNSLLMLFVHFSIWSSFAYWFVSYFVKEINPLTIFLTKNFFSYFSLLMELFPQHKVLL